MAHLIPSLLQPTCLCSDIWAFLTCHAFLRIRYPERGVFVRTYVNVVEILVNTYILARLCYLPCTFADFQARRMLDRVTIYLVVGLIGVTACAALAFFWHTKIHIGLYSIIFTRMHRVRVSHRFEMARSYFCLRGSSGPHTRARSGRLHDDGAVLSGS